MEMNVGQMGEKQLEVPVEYDMFACTYYASQSNRFFLQVFLLIQ